ncbi:uncharacterized protein LOC132031725 [Lycium ferocissimum]|uniref:uncharacterized protein LOC132031725 n=1 Tax=Lycium ferocissimum TaxID=112874 RepID=UPI00281601F5|nr:uncharacterized protein LOC132031725 [Lycium ferocissimum]
MGVAIFLLGARNGEMCFVRVLQHPKEKPSLFNSEQPTKTTYKYLSHRFFFTLSSILHSKKLQLHNIEPVRNNNSSLPQLCLFAPSTILCKCTREEWEAVRIKANLVIQDNILHNLELTLHKAILLKGIHPLKDTHLLKDILQPVILLHKDIHQLVAILHKRIPQLVDILRKVIPRLVDILHKDILQQVILRTKQGMETWDW